MKLYLLGMTAKKTTSTLETDTKLKVVESTLNKFSEVNYQNLAVDTAIEYSMYGPVWTIKNVEGTELTNQTFKVEIDPNWKVSQVYLPFDTLVEGNKVTDVVYRTNKVNAYRPYTGYVNPVNSQISTITKKQLGLDEDEFIIEMKANVGNFSTTYASSNLGHYGIRIYTYGSLVKGSGTANVRYSIYDTDDEANTLLTRKPIVAETSPASRSIISESRLNLKKSSISAGEQYEVTAFLKLHTQEYSQYNAHAIENPEIYIREIEGHKINLDDIKIYDQSGKEVFWVSEPKTNYLGEKVYVIKTIADEDGKPAIIGSHFGESEKVTKTLKVDVKFDTTPNTASGSYTTKDFISFGKPGYAPKGVYERPTFIDVYDLNGNGNTSEEMMDFYSATTLKIAESKMVEVQSFLTLKGEEAKDPYVEGDASTLAYFTPGTEADYTVKMKNNDKNPATTFITYIPIPKTGENFGAKFQTEAFKWDMTLSGLPTVSSEFKLMYAINATASNYHDDAIYTENIPADLTKVNMLKIVAKNTIAVGQEAEFKIPLMVDEDFNSATIGKKIATKNIYNPSYTVTGTIYDGTLPGTKVGAELSISEIGGFVFIDKNADGLYKATDGDTLVNNHEVELYKLNELTDVYEAVLDASNNPVKTKTNSDGVYNFDYSAGMNYGTYAVRFVEVNGAEYEYTPNNPIDSKINSDAIISGAQRGWAVGVDPTEPAAKTIGCGFLKYNPPIDLKAEILTPNGKKVRADKTLNVTSEVLYENWENIKSPTEAYTWSFVNPADGVKAQLVMQSDGSLTITPSALASGETTFQLGLDVKDIYGNTTISTGNPVTPVTITIVSDTKPTITSSDLNVYVGDSIDLISGVSAEDNTGTNIVFILSGADKNISVAHSIDVDAGKYAKPGTYKVEYEVTDGEGNKETAVNTVKVNGLPEVKATAQKYEITNTDILTGIKENPAAFWNKASDVVGEEATKTTIAGPANDLGGNDTIKYEVLSGPSGVLDFSKRGVYVVAYTAITPDGRRTSVNVDVAIVPEGMITETTRTLSITAEGFSLNYADAKNLTSTLALDEAHGNPFALKDEKNSIGEVVGFKDLTSKVEVYADELATIQNTPSSGGIYNLTYVIRDGGIEVVKTVKVVVVGETTPPVIITPDEELAITANHVTLTYEEAITMNKELAIDLSGAKAYLVKSGTEVVITIKEDQLAALKNVGENGGVYDVTFEANSDNIKTRASVTTDVTVKFTVQKKSAGSVVRKPSTLAGIDTGDTSDVVFYLAMAVIAGGYLVLRKKKITTK